MSVRRLCLSVALAVAAPTLALSIPASAGASVLVNAPSSPIMVGDAIKTGVWYQPGSGGAHWTRISITYKHASIWRRTVTATSSWKYYRYFTRRTGTYTVYYVTDGGTSVFHVRVVR